ncbi:Gfo/Idh/MocA family protein [Thalassobacillus sp. CUG 92003]|uniref:Gfo/Idh/MocA family protein n=1 Tax=Thalassobacillus sp. CUG 92003 TaxID=2736641 RepID=UPI0015E7335C|nr:Gfo/Idh/MocA family oxidoreductase [Thalassobacillus sp. CUG 92003]
MSDILKRIVLIGAGSMAMEYAKVLEAQNIDYLCIGRSQKSAERFTDMTGHSAISGGVDAYLSTSSSLPLQAIVSVGVDQLAPVTRSLLKHGVKQILVEKPAALNIDELRQLNQITTFQKANVYVAYNRRFYSSALKAEAFIREDGGVKSFTFDFTELGRRIQSSNTPADIKKNWLLANSTHVIDLAFHLGGEPQTITTHQATPLNWHPPGAVFCGAGKTKKGALFSYHANWNAPGRWGIELVTDNRRLRLQPLEELRVQMLDSFDFKQTRTDDELDAKYKPGLYRLVKAFLNVDVDPDPDPKLLTVSEQYRKAAQWYHPITYSSSPTL